MEHCKIHLGDALTVLKTLPDASIQTVVTSPPYFGLRNYGVDGQLGAESTPEEYIASLVAVFDEVYRVMRPDATCWLNLGDSYARNGGTDRTASKTAVVGSTRNTLQQMPDRKQSCPNGIKEKELIGIPWAVAFALRSRGFYLRQDIIWQKPNPMPESVKDRCTKSHEYIFLLTKSANYYYDGDAIKEPCSSANQPGNKSHRSALEYANGDAHHRTTSGLVAYAAKNASWKGSQFHTGKTGDHQLGRSQKERDRSLPRNRNGIAGSLDTFSGLKRNKRSVWSVATQPFPEAHFAVFPEKLIEPCILAGSRVGDIVLDPFCGAGTTAKVALRHGRQFIGIELNPKYIEIAERRLGKL